MKIWLCLLMLPRSGCARFAACELGALAGRKSELSLFTSLPMEGSDLTDNTTITIQAAMTSQRKRTEKRPRPAKNRSVKVNCSSPAHAQGGRFWLLRVAAAPA